MESTSSPYGRWKSRSCNAWQLGIAVVTWNFYRASLPNRCIGICVGILVPTIQVKYSIRISHVGEICCIDVFGIATVGATVGFPTPFFAALDADFMVFIAVPFQLCRFVERMITAL